MTAAALPPSRANRGRPTRAHAQARHDELLETALDMFLDRGFESTTMEGVAAAVGMTKRTIYARYPDKPALFRATVSRAIDRSIMPEAALGALDTGDLVGTLTELARLRVAYVTTPEGLKLQRIIAAESYRFPDIFLAAYQRAAAPVIAFLAGVIARADSVGAIARERPDMAARMFMSMVVGGPVRIIVSGNPLDQDEIDARIDFAVRLFLDGIRTR